MEIALEKLNGFKKIIFFALCGLYVLLYFCTFIYYVTNGAGVGSELMSFIGSPSSSTCCAAVLMADFARARFS